MDWSILRNQRLWFFLTSPSPRTEEDRDGQLLDKSRWTVEMRRRRQAAAATIGPRSSELKFLSLARFSHVLSVLEVCRWCHSILSRAKMKLKIIAGLEQCICSDLQDLRIDILQILRLCTKAITGRPWHENETKERRYLLVCYTETSQNTALPVQIEDTHSTWPGSVLF